MMIVSYTGKYDNCCMGSNATEEAVLLQQNMHAIYHIFESDLKMKLFFVFTIKSLGPGHCPPLNVE